MDNELRANIYDVAKLAQTSPTTVSRVLTKKNYPVSKELKKRVLDAVRTLNYTPNLVAKSLKINSINEIGVIVPNITNQFYAYSVLGIEEEANSNDYNILLYNSFRDSKREERCLQTLYEKQCKGVIISSMGKSTKIINEYVKKGMNFVFMDQKSTNEKCSHVIFDVKEGARMGVKYMAECGHKKIAFASTPLKRWSREQMLKGYKQALN